MRLHVISLGCQMSVADGDEMSGPFLDRGFKTTDQVDDANAVLINTCTVRQHAEDRAVSLIGRLRTWKEERPERFLIVAGCAAERLGGWIQKKFPFVDLVVGAKSIEQYPEILDEALRTRFNWTTENEGVWIPKHLKAPSPQRGEGGDEGDYPHPPLSLKEEGFETASKQLAETPQSITTYLTIMRGCNYSCTYCIVPTVRGREIYRPMDTILSEARRKIAAGAKEIVLLGQTVNSYHSSHYYPHPTPSLKGEGFGVTPRIYPETPSPLWGEGGDEGIDHENADFANLLRAMDAIPGLERIRFMSPHPYYLTDRMIAAMAECPKVCRHLHLPLQSGSDRILKAMRRNYTAQSYAAGLEKLRREIPDIEITTDVIAGFPGETENDFQQTLDFLDRIDPSAAYCFKFSPRPGTQAAEFAGQLPEDVIEGRHARLLESMDARTQRHLKSWIGREVRVLMETPQQGRTQYHFNAKLGIPPKNGVGNEITDFKPKSPKIYRAGNIISAVVTGVSRTGLEASPTKK